MIITVGINISWKTERKVRLNQDHKGRVESQSGFVSKWRRLTSSQFCHFTVLPFCHFTVFWIWLFCNFPLNSANLLILDKSLFVCSSETVFLFLLSSQISALVSKICFSCHLINAKSYFLISGAFKCHAKFICLLCQNTNDHTALHNAPAVN